MEAEHADHSWPLDEGDFIVRRMPVRISHQLCKSLHLAQYPVHTRSLPEKGVTARYKPGVKKLELSIPLNTNPAVYNVDRGKELALGAAEEDAKEKAAIEALTDQKDVKKEKRKRGTHTLHSSVLSSAKDAAMLKTQKLVSMQVPNQTNYMVGVVRDNELNLHPIAATMQLRPSLTYLDALEKLDKSSAAQGDEDEEENVEKPSGSKAVQVAIRHTAGTAQSSMLATRNAMFKPLRDDEEELWKPVGWHDVDTSHAEKAYSDMFSSSNALLQNHTSITDWVQKITIS